MRQDFIIQDRQFGTFYYFFDDFEFGGWQTSSDSIEADGFNSFEEAQRASGSIAKLSNELMIRRRIIEVELI